MAELVTLHKKRWPSEPVPELWQTFVQVNKTNYWQIVARSL